MSGKGDDMNRKVEKRTSVASEKSPGDLTDEDLRVLDLLEQARQNVKPIVKRELANEIVTQEMMAFRLK